MYHAYVRAQVGKLFESVNCGNAEPVLQLFSRKFEHFFVGQHALGGSRKTLATTREWYARLYRLLPDIHFDLRRIQVSGTPWKTIVVIEWDEKNSGTDGVQTCNSGLHVLELHWGKATRLMIWTDTVLLLTTLNRLGRHGTAEALAAPLVD